MFCARTVAWPGDADGCAKVGQRLGRKASCRYRGDRGHIKPKRPGVDKAPYLLFLCRPRHMLCRTKEKDERRPRKRVVNGPGGKGVTAAPHQRAALRKPTATGPREAAQRPTAPAPQAPAPAQVRLRGAGATSAVPPTLPTTRTAVNLLGCDAERCCAHTTDPGRSSAAPWVHARGTRAARVEAGEAYGDSRPSPPRTRWRCHLGAYGQAKASKMGVVSTLSRIANTGAGCHVITGIAHTVCSIYARSQGPPSRECDSSASKDASAAAQTPNSRSFPAHYLHRAENVAVVI